MKIEQFTKALKIIGKIYDDRNSLDKKEGLANFSKLFEGHESKTINSFVNLVEKKRKSHISSKA